MYLHLVDATDGITPETGEAGTKAKISFNGRAAVDSVNGIVAVDGTNQPGTYYLELSTSEIVHPGMLVVRYKSAATAEFVQTCQVMTFDPYTYTGVIGGGGGADVSYEKIRKIVQEELGTLPAPTATANVDMVPFSEGLQAVLSEIRDIDIPKPEKISLEPILERLAGLQRAVRGIRMPEIPKIDLTELTRYCEQMMEALERLEDRPEMDMKPVMKAVADLDKAISKTPLFRLDHQSVQLPTPKPKRDVIKEYLNLK